MLNNLIKSAIDITAILSIKNIMNSDFIENIILAFCVVIINYLIIPLIKNIVDKIKGLKTEDKEKLKDEIDKIINETIDKKDKK